MSTIKSDSQNIKESLHSSFKNSTTEVTQPVKYHKYIKANQTSIKESTSKNSTFHKET
jgi:hypothetical protein